MRAAVIYDYDQPLRIEELPLPAPGPDDVLLRVEACGVCHSDLHLARGDWPQMRKLVTLPLTAGHEVVGIVIARGENVGNLDEGARVGVAWLHWACGHCEFCRENMENVCPNQLITGATVPGGFADYLLAKASHVIPVPAGLDSAEAAPLFCAGLTVHRALKKAEAKSGQRIAVFGVGGLGHLAVQFAAAYGAEVIAIDVADDKLALASELGAGVTINATTENPVRALRRAGGAHIALVASASVAAYEAAFASLRPGGTLAVVGIPAEPICFSAMNAVSREARVIASAVGTRDDLREVLALADAGKVRCRVETDRLEGLNEVFDRMHRGELKGRVVIRF